MFEDPFHIRYFANFIKLFDNLRKVLLSDIYDGGIGMFQPIEHDLFSNEFWGDDVKDYKDMDPPVYLASFS